MSIKTTYSIKDDIDEAVKEIKNNLNEDDLKFLLFFTNPNLSPEIISKKIKENFNNSITAGCTTASEFFNNKFLRNSIVAMSFTSNEIELIKAEVVNLNDINNSVKKAFESFEKYFDVPMNEMDYQKYVGIVIPNGLTPHEEELMEKIGNLTNIMFVGGSSADYLKFEKTHLYLDGENYTNSALLIIMKPKVKFSFFKTQSVKTLDKKLLATKADGRTVYEFNNKPAALAYAEALNIPIEKLSIDELFFSHPVGIVMSADDNDIFVRAAKEIKEDKSVTFHCNIFEGTEVSVLESIDVINETTRIIENKKIEMGKITGLINFHCVGRTLLLERAGQQEEYGKIFEGIPHIGFSTYGEQFIGHMNHTSTMLAFGE